MTLPSFVPQLKLKLEMLREKGEVFIGNDELRSWQRKPTATSSKFVTATFGVIRRHWRLLHGPEAQVPATYVQDYVEGDGGITLVTNGRASKTDAQEWFTLDDYAEQTTTALKKRRKYPIGR